VPIGVKVQVLSRVPEIIFKKQPSKEAVFILQFDLIFKK